MTRTYHTDDVTPHIRWQIPTSPIPPSQPNTKTRPACHSKVCSMNLVHLTSFNPVFTFNSLSYFSYVYSRSTTYKMTYSFLHCYYKMVRSGNGVGFLQYLLQYIHYACEFSLEYLVAQDIILSFALLFEKMRE